MIYWAIYPEFIRQIFIRAFTAGIKDPEHGRVRENEWRSALINLRDAIFYCSCGAQNFYDADRVNSGATASCWGCKNTLTYPPRLVIENQNIMLNHDTHLYPHHLDKSGKYNFSSIEATVVRHPQDLSRWGLQNMGTVPWTITLADKSIKTVEPQRSVNLSNGITINFGNTLAQIQA
jgi:hypothetical protein